MRKLLVFSAKWCAPCKIMGPRIEAVVVDLNLEVAYIDIDKNPDVVETYEVKAVPTLVLLEDGLVLRTSLGQLSEAELRDFLRD